MPSRGAARIAATLLSTALVACGCDTMLAGGIVRSPNGGRPRAVEISDAVEAARVDHAGVPIQTYRLDPAATPAGTVVVLHGILDDARRPLPFAKKFRADGFRVVLIDLRGHGGSGGDHIGYGALEAGDVSAVLDDLAARHLLAGPVFVWGYSLGAATAIQAAAQDRRIDAVMAVGAFTSMREEVPRFGRMFVPLLGWRSDRAYAAAIDEAGRRAGFDPDAASPVAAIRTIDRPILLIHGDTDWIVPATHAASLTAAAPAKAEAVLLPGFGHWDLRDDKAGRVSTLCREWLRQIVDAVPSPGTPGEG